jgi:hypothetical protein
MGRRTGGPCLVAHPRHTLGARTLSQQRLGTCNRYGRVRPSAILAPSLQPRTVTMASRHSSPNSDNRRLGLAINLLVSLLVWGAVILAIAFLL